MSMEGPKKNSLEESDFLKQLKDLDKKIERTIKLGDKINSILKNEGLFMERRVHRSVALFYNLIEELFLIWLENDEVAHILEMQEILVGLDKSMIKVVGFYKHNQNATSNLIQREIKPLLENLREIIQKHIALGRAQK